MMRDGLYAAYTWRVRHFAESDPHEATIVFRPDGRPYAFTERIKEDAPGPALAPADARAVAEAGARERWAIDFNQYTLVEQGQERRPSGRVDHSLPTSAQRRRWARAATGSVSSSPAIGSRRCRHL